MKIVLGPSSASLGAKIAETLGVETVSVISKMFPDGEVYIRMEGNLQKDAVFIVHTTMPPQEIHLIQLALMIDAAKRGQAKSITAVVPYLAYARQDKRFLPGEPISIQVIARMLTAVGLDRLITVNVHAQAGLAAFALPTTNLSAVWWLADHFKKKGITEAFVLAPDRGALSMAQEANAVLQGGFGYLEKRRDRYTGQIQVQNKAFKVKNKPVIIFDDIISTGGTIIAAAKLLNKLDAGPVYAACVHPLLVQGAEKRILEAGVQEVVGTDSIPTSAGKVSLAPLLSEAIKRA